MFHFPIRRRSMPCRGWQSLNVPSGWVWTAPSVYEVAVCTGGVSCTVREVASAQVPQSIPPQPCSRSGRRRRSFRGVEIGECDPGVGGDEPICTVFGRGIEGGPRQTCTFQGPCASKHHQNSTKGPPRERRKKENCGGEGNKSAKFWVPHPSVPHPSVPHPSGPHLSGFGPPPFGGKTFGAPILRGPTFVGLGSHLSGPTPKQAPIPFANFSFVPMLFFLSRLSFFVLSRMQFFTLSRQQVAYFVPFPFFLSRGVFFVPRNTTLAPLQERIKSRTCRQRVARR